MKKRLRKQQVNIAGFRATKFGAPSAMGDLYYSALEISWPAFIASVSVVFLVVNLAFGLVYAFLPGSIHGMQPGSIADGFFFSVETLATVGYGFMAPETRVGHVVSAIEILTGLFFSATVTGLIFARFARPRDSIVFSRVAVIGRFEGHDALMVRVATTRARPLANVVAQMAWLQQVDLPDGRYIRRLVDLPLVRAQNVLMGLSWTLVHLLESDSVLYTAIDGKRFQLTVTVSGLDTLLASQASGARSYRRAEIFSDHEFVDVITDVDDGVEFDLSKLHDTRAIGQA